MTDRVPSWPPTDIELKWRPEPSAPPDSVGVEQLKADDGTTPAWLDEQAITIDAYGDGEVPAYALAAVETDAGRPGGGGLSVVWAVPSAGGFRIMITNDDEIPFESPIEFTPELPTLGELLQILDETEVDGERYGVGHPTRENSDEDHRENLRRFVTISSDLYPMLGPLDQSRLDQWIAERP